MHDHDRKPDDDHALSHQLLTPFYRCRASQTAAKGLFPVWRRWTKCIFSCTDYCDIFNLNPRVLTLGLWLDLVSLFIVILDTMGSWLCYLHIVKLITINYLLLILETFIWNICLLYCSCRSLKSWYLKQGSCWPRQAEQPVARAEGPRWEGAEGGEGAPWEGVGRVQNENSLLWIRGEILA